MIKTCFRKAAIAALSIVLLGGCANQSINEARGLYFQGQYRAASDRLPECRTLKEKHQFLCQVEKGTALLASGEYEESVSHFLAAKRYIKARDYISVSQQTTASITSDYALDYVGESAEQLWIHTYLMMNFLMLGDYEAARVEAKQALERYEAKPEALSEAYFTRALIALCFEIFGQYDDARIEYDRLNMNLPLLPPLSKQQSELVLMIASGRGPKKVAVEFVAPPTIKISIPEYQVVTPYVEPRLSLPPVKPDQTLQVSSNTYEIVKKSLNDRMKGVIARQTLRATGKEALADSVEEGSLAEFVIRTALFIAEQADTRSWQTLPAGFHLIRIALPPGRHRVEVDVVDVVDGAQVNYLNDYPINHSEIDLKPDERKLLFIPM